jgi:glycosyltransferase involved in cell wall biosynthesis
MKDKEIAILIPAYNEELTITKVIKDFKKELPEAKIYVYNNNSKDKTEELAKKENVIVVNETRQGKGNVVRSMFKDIDADIYVMVDADDTYPAEAVHELIKPIYDNRADMVNGDRLTNGAYYNENKRAFHNLGNNLVRNIICKLYKSNVKDIMTGYRAFNYDFVKGMPVLSKKFEIETEMTLHCLDKNYRLIEVPIDYRDRPEGSVSKLNTIKDGFAVIHAIFDIYKNYKPLQFFGFFTTNYS